MGDTRELEESAVIPELGQTWEHIWNGVTTLYLILEDVDVSKHRLTENVPEPGFCILRLDDGLITYLVGSWLESSIWRRVT